MDDASFVVEKGVANAIMIGVSGTAHMERNMMDLERGYYRKTC